MTISLTDEEWEQLCYFLGYAEAQLSEHDCKEQSRQVERLYQSLQNQNINDQTTKSS